MNFIIFFLFRKFFLKTEFTDNKIILEKGILFKRLMVIPESSVVKIRVKRTFILRVFRAKELRLYTLNGSVVLFMKKEETLPFLPKDVSAAVLKPRFFEIMFGAFIDTRALGGILLFTALLRRIGGIFGSEYTERIISAISDTAVRVSEVLSFLNIAVPRIAVLIAVFILGAWVFAFLKKLTNLARFRVLKYGGGILIKSGLFTLYENYIPNNSSAAVCCDTLTTLIFKRAPLYRRGVMICPCVHRKKLSWILNELCGIKATDSPLFTSPHSAFFGHCSAPLSWSGIFSVTLIFVYSQSAFRWAMLLKTILYGGLIISLYTAAVYLYYMKFSGLSIGNQSFLIAFRRNMRLYRVFSPNGVAVRVTVSQNPFQRKSKLCTLKLSTSNREHFYGRQLPINIIRGIPVRSTLRLPRFLHLPPTQ